MINAIAMEEQLHQIEGYAHIVQLLIKCKQWCERTAIGGSREMSQREKQQIQTTNKANS